MSQLMLRPLSSSSSVFSPLPAEPDATTDLMLADAIGFLRLGQREQALEIVAILQLSIGVHRSTLRALFNGLQLEPSSRDAGQLIKDASAHAALGNRESGLACLVMALSCRDVMFEFPRAIERVVRALNVAVQLGPISPPKLPPLTITLS
ncbi:MAG: hypothetical protein ACO1OB_13180 [Archangium sp.]